MAIVLASVFFAFMGGGDEDEGSSEKDKFLYTWDETDTGESFNRTHTFYDNGTVKTTESSSYYSSTNTYWNNWSLNADDKTITVNENTYNYTFSNGGDMLELNDNGQTFLTLQKQDSGDGSTSDGSDSGGDTISEKDKFLYTWEVVDSNTTGDITGATYTFYDNGTYNFQYSNTDIWGDWNLNAGENTITMGENTVDYSFSNGDNTLELSNENTKLTLQKQ